MVRWNSGTIFKIEITDLVLCKPWIGKWWSITIVIQWGVSLLRILSIESHDQLQGKYE